MAMDQNEVSVLIERAVARSFGAVFGDEPPVLAVVNLSERTLALRVGDDENYFSIPLGEKPE